MHFVVVVIYRNSPFVRQHQNVSKGQTRDMIAVWERASERQGAIWEEPDGTLHSISVIYQNQNLKSDTPSYIF